ncbi:centromere protein C-like isoform X3 [Primulina huaijiensis]|uniref:centromere protein C-like isoform X3 n=1 Tax=Primulina huaijiensis TaxID=1492673 RepID=UPI003CC71970
MAGGPLTSDLLDPLSELNGPLVFPRAIRASLGDSVPIDSDDLDSINEFMKSRGLRNPEKLMIEAKRVVDSRTAILDSNLASFAKNVNVSDAVSKKGKDMPRDRRQGLRLARKRAPFTLKTSLSQPVSLEPSLDIDKLQDPDEFFDAYERLEKAKKEIQKQLGNSMDNVNEFKPSTKPRLRRQGILGKSYHYRHRYPSVSFENDMLMSSQEVVEQHVPSVPRDEPAEKLITLNSNLYIDSDEIESVASMRKKDTEANSLLDDLLSCDLGDLDGGGALNLLQERLNIKPLDLDSLSIPELHDFQRINKFSVRESVQKPQKTSFVIDNVLKNIHGKQSMNHEHTATDLVNQIASPTPPRSSWASLSFLKKRILQSNPLRDAFSPLNLDLSASRTAHPVEPTDILDEQVGATTVSRISSELESHVGVEVTEPTDSNIDPQKVLGCSDNLPHQFIDNNSSMEGEKACSGPVEAPEDNNVEETINVEQLNDKDEGKDASARRHFFDIEQLPKVRQTKFLRRKREADDELIRKEPRKSLADAESGTPLETEAQRKKRIKVRSLEYGKGEKSVSGHLKDDQSNLSACEDEATHAPSRDGQLDAEEQLEVHQTKLRRRKRETGDECLRKLHPLRKSFAGDATESGTSFENGVRRSKRFKMRPLEFWKGERFLYERVNGNWDYFIKGPRNLRMNLVFIGVPKCFTKFLVARGLKQRNLSLSSHFNWINMFFDTYSEYKCIL